MLVSKWTCRGAAVLVCVALGAGCSNTEPSDSEEVDTAVEATRMCSVRKMRNEFTVNLLVSDIPDVAPVTDPKLKNAWGLAAGPTSAWWVADNGTDFATLYNGNGAKQDLEVSVPGAPTGLVFAGGDGFPVTNDSASGPAVFIFATESGTLLGWNPGVPPPPPSRQAFPEVDNSPEGAIYKGLAIANTPDGRRLYATDFHNGKVDVFDDTWAPVKLPCDAFVDRRIPEGYAPFGIRTIGDKIIVTYALQDEDAEDDVAGRGHGFVDAFDFDGEFLFRIATRGRLDSPWGLVIAPEEFGRFAGALLVGNFGDGRINAFDLSRCNRHGCARLGALRDEQGDPIVIDGLWSLDFGMGVNTPTGAKDHLFFTAGPNGEENGLFGFIERAGKDED